MPDVAAALDDADISEDDMTPFSLAPSAVAAASFAEESSTRLSLDSVSFPVAKQKNVETFLFPPQLISVSQRKSLILFLI